MFLVSGPELVLEACKAGVIGALPRKNARGIGTFDRWLELIFRGLIEAENAPDKHTSAPIAVNLDTRADRSSLTEDLRVCAKYGVELILSSSGDPTQLTKAVHDWNGLVFHDVTNLRHAEKAIQAGVDGITCIGAGGGGHGGSLSPMVLVPRVREMFSGTIGFGGGISDGRGIRAAEVLGADLIHLGTRFIATQESAAAAAYKQLLVAATATDIVYSDEVSGTYGSWLATSLQRRAATASPSGPEARIRPWADAWSAGQGVELISDVPTVAELVARLRREYVAACATPDMAVKAAVNPPNQKKTTSDTLV